MTVTARSPRWFDALAPVVAEVTCDDGATHRVRWARGKVVLHDHSLRDEAVVHAFGGPVPPCVEVLHAWRDRRGWAAATRPDAPGFTRRAPTPSVPNALHAIRRLAVVRSWERAWRRDVGVEHAEDLYRLLRKRALPAMTVALESARRELGGGRATFAEVRLAKPGATPSVDGRIDRVRAGLVVSLGPQWLYEVDAIGPALVRDAFVVAPGHVVTWFDAGDGGWTPAISALASGELADDARGVVVGDAFDDAAIDDAGDVAHP